MSKPNFRQTREHLTTNTYADYLEITYMCNKNSILLMSNHTEAIFVASLARRRRLTPF